MKLKAGSQGMRIGLVRLLAALLLVTPPALVTTALVTTESAAASQSNTAKATKAKSPAKAAAKKASKTAARTSKSTKSKYAPRIYSAIVVDAGTGRVLNEVNADVRGYPASLTKMMTLYMLFEALERKELAMDSHIPVSARAAAAAPSKLYLTPKMTITVEQAIQALATKSANDVAVATGERLGGTEDRFAEKMTAKARALGMKQTTFKNASGLPNPEQFSTARDMSVLANRLIKDFPQYYGEFSRMDFDFRGQTIRTHNRLLEFYEGADGIKTGYTAASGFNLVASATRNGYRVIGVIFGGASAKARDQKLAGLMDQGFAALSGQPETAIANRVTAPSDDIATQIALADPGAGITNEDNTEQGDRDEPFTPVTTSNSVIETTSIPPLPQIAPARPTRVATLEPRTVNTAAVVAVDVPTQQIAAATWGVQLGAYSSRTKAETQATNAALKLKATFSGATAFIMPIKGKAGTVYRARVVGLGDTNKDLIKACVMIRSLAKAGCQAVSPVENRIAASAR